MAWVLMFSLSVMLMGLLQVFGMYAKLCSGWVRREEFCYRSG